MTTTLLLLGMIFGCLGLAYCTYGRRQERPLAFLAGVLLMAIPYVISDPLLLIALSSLIAALPFLRR